MGFEFPQLLRAPRGQESPHRQRKRLVTGPLHAKNRGAKIVAIAS
jgi:hypothetical protein